MTSVEPEETWGAMLLVSHPWEKGVLGQDPCRGQSGNGGRSKIPTNIGVAVLSEE